MTAALAAAKVDVNVPNAEVNLSGVKEMRSSVEVSNSCNCFQNCFPCFKKKPKSDPRRIQERSAREHRTIEIMQSALAPAPASARNDIVRSPKMDTLSHPHMTVDLHIDCGDSPRDLSEARRIQSGER